MHLIPPGMSPDPGSSSSALLASPARLRALAGWLDEAGSLDLAEAARVAAARLEEVRTARGAESPRPADDVESDSAGAAKP